MSSIPPKVLSRFNKTLKQFVTVLENAKARDVNENDTVRIIWDMLSDIFGYDKYTDITSEYAVRGGTYCDLAIKDGSSIRYLIECKAIDKDLKTNYMKQAVDYATREGINWTILTNGIKWEIYKIVFSKPIDYKLVFELDFFNDDIRDSKFIDRLYLLSKEAISKSAIEAFHEERLLINKHTISAILQSDDTAKVIRRQLALISKDVSSHSIDIDLIQTIIVNDIVKRELVDNEQVNSALRKLERLSKKKSKPKTEKKEDTPIITSTIPEEPTSEISNQVPDIKDMPEAENINDKE
ncbi:MAG: type I restriction enzyme HsdR N-terminal domain-containing protein [Candidatus Anammoxibacter sp.]